MSMGTSSGTKKLSRMFSGNMSLRSNHSRAMARICSLVRSGGSPPPPLLLVEIPADFLALKAARPDLAAGWRMRKRAVFEALFAQGYLATDFVHVPGEPAHSYYVLSYGESTL